MKEWFQLFRAQTAPATTLSLVTPLLISGCNNILLILILFILAHPIHYFCFGHNSLMDYWLDKEDPSKKHHPLPSGKISIESATKVLLYGQIIVFIILLIIILYYSLNPILSLTFLLFYILFGHAYNDGLDHRTTHSWIPISLCFASFPLVTYTFFKTIDNIAILIFLWAFIVQIYEIALLGNLKDLWNPFEKYNLLRRFIIYQSNDIIVLNKSLLCFFLFLRGVISTLLLLIMFYLLKLPLENLICLIVLTIIELYAVLSIHIELQSYKPKNRDKLLSLFGLAESTEFFRFTTLVPITFTFILITYGLIYFVLANKLLWGTRLGPKV